SRMSPARDASANTEQPIRYARVSGSRSTIPCSASVRSVREIWLLSCSTSSAIRTTPSPPASASSEASASRTRRPRRRPVAAETRERVRGAEEVPAVADLDVRVECERRLVDLDGRELALEEIEELAVRDELLEARHQAALEPAGRLPADVRAREEGAEERVER